MKLFKENSCDSSREELLSFIVSRLNIKVLDEIATNMRNTKNKITKYSFISTNIRFPKRYRSCCQNFLE